ncbi:MarR family winged helix-turn-helix transcriptional regulator [Caloranaerobacter azorensis]|uniref:Transcriptional regulator, MarR family n=2 Tax=Caloranaerobacter azorensis TaxID=116090 RepID=A0A1M5RFK9_9FIRM|nr:MarR family transcriptional regulator [Caloranaerobacter azorensis]QIB27995.1 MarR family transcriptional regulator [Caloranaerobacter azorensis]SHH24906.1 transcriptional regulator, MarR family [Caloranaerobacter azorensis DSM 13643]
MNEEKIKEIYSNLFEFVSLFHRKFGASFRHGTDKYNCKKNQNRAIMIIGKHGKITPTDLGKFLDMRKGSLTSLVDSLEKLNLVVRKVDKEDRRKTWLHLTDEGKSYLENKKKEIEKAVISQFSKLNNEEIDLFLKNIREIVDIFKKI